MYPIIKNTTQTLAHLDNITSNELTRTINGPFDFSFECYEAPFKSMYVQFGNMIEVDGQTFDINYIETNHSIGIAHNVKCEHIFYRLADTLIVGYANTGTPASILTDLLVDTDFTVGTVEYTDPIIFAVNQNASKMAIILSLVNSLGGKIDFSNKGFSIDIKATLGADRGFQARIKKNIEGISKVLDKRGTDKATYNIDLINVFASDDFILSGFANFETVEIGDRIRIIDETANIDTYQYITTIRKDVIKETSTSVTLGDNFDTLADKISFIENQSIKQTDVIFGVRLNDNVGLQITSGDQEGRANFNANEMAMQSFVDGSWVNDLYFDRIKKKFIFNGELSANLIAALEAEFDITISNTVIVNNLTAEKGNIADLTVDQLDTSDMVQNYLNEVFSNVNYIRVHDQQIEYVMAIRIAGERQVTNRKSEPIYWTDGTFVGTTLTVTDYPVMVYNYAEEIKMVMKFEIIDGVYVPLIQMGTGNGTGEQQKAYIFKDAQGLLLRYINASDIVRELRLGESGITVANNSGSVGIRNIAISTTAPATPQNNDLWIDTDA